MRKLCLQSCANVNLDLLRSPDNVNYCRPGQIPLLNNSPVIVLRDGKLKLAMGTPGGEAIGQTQFRAHLSLSLAALLPAQDFIHCRFAAQSAS